MIFTSFLFFQTFSDYFHKWFCLHDKFIFKMADGEEDMQLPHIGDLAQDLPAFDEENEFEPVSPGTLIDV